MSYSKKILDLISNVSNVVKGQDESIKKIISVFLSEGHVLLEDMPGTGKTTIAKTIAKTLGLQFSRIQFTPDLMPSDILGITIYNQKNNMFEFHEGPIFTNIVLADEINRASPRTQSALLEAMGEKQVSIDRITYKLNNNFFVIATENPSDFHGTYPLPEAQMDRFYMRFSLGYISKVEEIKVLKMVEDHRDVIDAPILSEQDINQLKKEISEVHMSDAIYNYIVDIVRATRDNEDIRIGSSLRTAIAMVKIAKCYAYIDNRDFVEPDDVLLIVHDCLGHKIVLSDDSKYKNKTEKDVINEILIKIKCA